MSETTYIFRDGKVYTYEDGKVTAAVKEADFAPPMDSQHSGQPVAMPDPPPDIQGDLGQESSCPNCGSPSSPNDHFCPACGSPLNQEGIGGGEAGLYGVEPPPTAQAVAHVTTPNGLKGKVLGRVQGLWNEEVTVRLENGRIVRLPVAKDFKFAKEEVEVPEDPVAALDVRLAARTDPDRDSLLARRKELRAIQTEARSRVKSASDGEAVKLNKIVVTADYELREVGDAIQHIAELEGRGYEPPAPFSINPVEQESVGLGEKGHANWLDGVVGEMIQEAENHDYNKLMDEGPEAFVAGLDEPVLDDAGAVRQLASSEIRSHTAGQHDEDIRRRYEHVWLARVEQVRQAAASKVVTQRKQAAAEEEPYTGPDEGLFT